ncbi:hypothetical protein L7F22_021528 [Adiantum nelumboides]|nr:hypothetical protein [Adiantum nelumboides]
MGADDIAIHARLTVVPGKPSPTSKGHKLSYLDHLMQKHYLRALYYYNTSSVKDRSNLLSFLKETLCKALSIYPLFAGRLQKREDGLWEVKLNDAGVRVYEATCGLSMQEFFAKCFHSQLESELCRHEINSDHTITPVAVMQLTEFSCGNLAIGFSWHHAIGDAMCGTLFMKAWSETHRAVQILHPPFFHPPSLRPRPQSNPEVRCREYYASALFNKEKEVGDAPEDHCSLTLSFSHEVVEQLISEVQNGSCKYGPPTPADVLAAILWVAVCRAQGKAKSDVVKASLCLEFRKIHLPPLPFGYVGNAQHFAQLSCPMKMQEGNDLSHVASIINESGGMVDSEEVKSVIDLVQEMEDQGKDLLRDPPFFYSDGLTIVIFDHFFCNEIDFGFGKPVRVGYFVQPVKGEGHIIIAPGSEGKSSRNVAVVLPKDVMEKLLKDSDLVRFLPGLQACNE